MKTNKHQTLLLVNKKQSVRAVDITGQFGYSAGTARSYLSYLARQGLLERTTRGYVLTDKGTDRLQYFNVSSCGSFDCPLCLEKKIGYFTCTRCGYRIDTNEAMILPKRDFLLFVRNAGVYCPTCKKLIFSEKQAELIGISRKDGDK